MGMVPRGEVLVLAQLIYGNRRPMEPIVISLPYFTSRSTVYDVLRIGVDLQRTAVLRQGFIAWLTGFPQRVHDGDFLRVLLDDLPPDNKDDDVSLTQTTLQIGTITMRTIPGLPDEYLSLRRERLEEELQQIGTVGDGQLVLHDPDGWMRFADAVQRNEVAPIVVIFHGLLFRSIGSRRALLPGLHFVSIEASIRSLWPEFDALEKKAYLVKPQPTLGFPDHEAVSVVVEFYDHLHEPDASIVPVLQECSRPSATELSMVAAYVSQTFHGDQSQVDSENCPTDLESTRTDYWVRNQPVYPGRGKLVEHGDLVTIRVLNVIGTFGTFSPIFPGGYEFSHSMSELSALTDRRPATWTFVGATLHGTPAVIDYFQPQWEGLHDPHRVQHFFQSLMVSRGLDVTEYELHHVPSPLQIDSTFIYGKRGTEGCLVHMVWSARWNETWREQYCHLVPFQVTPADIVSRAGLHNYDWNMLVDGCRVEANAALSLSPGVQIEVDLDQDPSSEEHNATSGSDETSMWQKIIVTEGRCLPEAPQVKQHRPNQELQQDFDDIIPYTFRGIPGLVVPPPNWQENPIFRIAASSGIATRDGSGRLTMMVRAWLVKHGEDRIRTYRDFAIRPQLLVHLPETVRRVWLDQIGATAHLIVHAVRPTPLAEPDGTRFLHVIGEVSRPRVCGYQPVLIASRQITANGVEDPERYPCLMPIRFGIADVFGVTQPRCEQFQVLVPMQGRVRRWLTPYIQREATPGMFLPTWWDRRLQPLPAPIYDQAPDDTSLLQNAVKQLLPVKSRLPEDPPSAQEYGACPSDQDLLDQLDQLAPRHPHAVPDDVARATFSHHLDMLVANGTNARHPQEIETYGLYIQPLEKRTLRVEDLATQTLLAEIRRVWHDIPHPFTAILVRPSEEEPTKMILIVEFLDFHRLPLQGTTPTLRTILDADLSGPIVQAAYHVGEVQPYLLVGQVPLRHKCQPWNDRRCEVRLNGHLLPPLSRYRLEEGDRLEFRVHQQEEADEGDEGLSLMQRSVSRSPRRELPASTSTASGGPDLMQVHTFHMSADHKLVQLDRARSMSYTDQLQQIWRFPPHTTILRLHEVRHPPLDLESTSQATLLIERTVDLNRQAIADDQLVLVDLVLSGAAGLADAIRIRRVVWTRRFMTRPAILHLFAVQEFCNSPAVACRLLLNHEVWDHQDMASREMRNGGFLCLRVSGPVSTTSHEVRLVLTDQEHADANKFLYCSSPLRSPRPSTPIEEGGESEQEIFQDPPVDSSDTPDDNADLVLEDWTNRDLEMRYSIHDQNGVGLVELQQSKRGKRLMQHGHLRQTVDPHVSDLWCVKQSAAGPCSIPPSAVAGGAIPSAPADIDRHLFQRQVLSLQDLIPQEPQELTEGCVASSIPGLQALVDHLLQPRLNLDVTVPFLEVMDEDLQQLVRDALSVSQTRHDCPMMFQVYTDGSKLWNVERAEEVSAWAIVIVAVWPDGQEGIVGCQSAAVQTNSDQPGWIGSTWPDSYQAEMEAIIRALIWLCQEPMIQGGL